jgi:hypothetical protein
LYSLNALYSLRSLHSLNSLWPLISRRSFYITSIKPRCAM